MWYLRKGQCLQRIIQLEEIGRVAKHVVFVTLQRLSNIFLSECAYMLDSCGEQYACIVFGIAPPLNFENLFYQWLGEQIPNLYLLTGAAAFYWEIWLARDEVVFDECQPKTFMQVLFGGTYWLWQQVQLQLNDVIEKMMIQACKSLEISALYFFFLPWLAIQFTDRFVILYLFFSTWFISSVDLLLVRMFGLISSWQGGEARTLFVIKKKNR